MSQIAFAAEPEVLLGVTYDTEGITFQVKSGGCTDQKHFELLVYESMPMTAELIRRTEDLCEAAVPFGKKIRFTYKELGLPKHTTIHLNNLVKPGAITVY